jgi:hypothetical protein
VCAQVPKQECLRANLSAQKLRNESKLAAARHELRVCADESCPTIVRDDCALRLDEINRVQPTIVFEVKDSAGGDVAAATVAVDGAPGLALEGTPLLVDPGTHTFSFRAPGSAVVTRTLVLTEGDKGRRERVVLAASKRDVGPATFSVSRRVALGVGAVGVAGLVAGGIFGGLAASQESQQKHDCSASTVSACPNYSGALSAHSASLTDGAVSTAGFIGGGALVAASILLWIVGAPARTSTALVPTVGNGAVGLAWEGRM